VIWEAPLTVIGTVAVEPVQTGCDTAVVTGALGMLLTVMVLDVGASVLPQASVAVHVSVRLLPQAGGGAERVEAAEVPDNRQAPDNPLV